MNENKMSILDLDDYCMLMIIKYIIADCENRGKTQGKRMKYFNLVSFALAHENLEAVLEQYYNDLYRDLEFVFVARKKRAKINFSELQTIPGKEGDTFWQFYADAFRKNSVIRSVELFFEPDSFQPEFENKRSLEAVKITLKGYSLEDLNNYGHLTYLYLDVRMSAEALVSVCMSNPELLFLEFMSTEIHGRLSDIVPHCRNLRSLKFVPKPDLDGAEYEPLSQLPSLEDMTIHGVYGNGLLLTMLKAIRKWRRTRSFIIHFSDMLPALSEVTIASWDSFCELKILIQESPDAGIELITTYPFLEISKDSRPLEQTLATITLIEANLSIDWREFNLSQCRTSDINISKLTSLASLFDTKRLYIKNRIRRNEEWQTPLATILGSMKPDGQFALKSLYIENCLDHSDTLELVKIKSINFLDCSFSDWESLQLLSELTNLQVLKINVRKEFEKTHLKALCTLLITCQVRGVIHLKDWKIEFRKNEQSPGQVNSIKTLKILKVWKMEFRKGKQSLGLVNNIKTRKILQAWEIESLNKLFDAFANTDLITIEEVDLSLVDLHFKDILKVAEVQTIRKLRLKLSGTDGIEKLAQLNELKELTIFHKGKGSLIKLFEPFAMKKSLSLQHLQFRSEDLSPKEILMISRITSLKALKLIGPITEDFASLTELAKSNIEDLTLIVHPPFSLEKLFAAFAKQINPRLQTLQVSTRYLDQRELEELTKLRSLRTFHTWNSGSRYLSSLRKMKNLENLTVSYMDVDLKLNLPNLKKIVVTAPIGFNEWLRLTELENLEELIIKVTDDSLSKVYHVFASKSVSKLKHISAPISCVEELNELTKIKSLKKLHLQFKNVFENLTELSQLTELESLQIKSYYNLSKAQYKIDTVLAILKSCRNLDSLSIEYTFLKRAKFMNDVHTLLKSIRDPALQRPLILSVLEDTFVYHQFLFLRLKYIDDDYLKVLSIFND